MCHPEVLLFNFSEGIIGPLWLLLAPVINGYIKRQIEAVETEGDQQTLAVEQRQSLGIIFPYLEVS